MSDARPMTPCAAPRSSAGLLTPRFPQGIRRARRDASAPRAAAESLGGACAGRSTRASHGEPPARFVDRDRRRRTRDGVHGQGRARPGHLHRADAAHRRRAVGADRPRHARAVRHRPSRRIRARRRAASRIRRTSIRRNLALAGATAREALLALASARLGVPVDAARRLTTARSRRRRSVQAGQLRRAGRRTDLQRPAQPGSQAKARRASGPCSARPYRGSTCPPW